MDPKFKLKAVNFCKEILQNKIKIINHALQEVTFAGNSETKSTAGDKHETGRAMMQLEQEKLGNQLLELENQLLEFKKIDFNIQSLKIKNGSLVETNNGVFLLASAIGKLEIDNNVIYIITTKSPLGDSLLGLKPTDENLFNHINYKIITIS